LAQSEHLPSLTILFGGATAADNPDPIMRNIYSVIPVNPDLHENVDYELAQQFVDWISSVEVQVVIGEFGKEEFGIPLFYPDSNEWHSQSGFREPSNLAVKSFDSG
jgi:tungstate transport system substrate-binding protein